jgi:hypothetical protein
VDGLRRMTTAGVLAAAVLAGCGGGSDDSRFSGDELAVAEAIEALEQASREGNAERICNELFTDRFVREISRTTGGQSCLQRVRTRFLADDADLQIRSIQVAGGRATAVVREQNGNRTRLTLLRQSDEWRVDGIAAAR